MFNIGKLRADAVDYYLGSVAPTATDYYFGQGEAAGRWTGSLAPELGLFGAVDEEELRRLLDGLHPKTGDPLVSAAGSNARAQRRQATPTAPTPAPDGPNGTGLDVAQVAAQLRVSTRAVRHWLTAGERVWAEVQAATPEQVLAAAGEVRARLAELSSAGAAPNGLPERYLLGTRELSNAHGGARQRWSVPQAETDLFSDARRAAGAQAGWDLVFRPPKSYSLLWGVGGPALGAEIHAIHTEAVEAALAYLEDAAIAARTAHGGRVIRTQAEGLVVAAFDHRDSRAGDPLLHSHCVVANVTRRPDKRWVALQSRGLYRHGLAADALYQATFRHLAERRLGLQSEPVVNGWADVAGVPRSVIEHFSKRSEEIAAEVDRVGSDSARTREIAAVSTRRAKGHSRAALGLHDRWRAEAAAVGFGPEAVAACLGRSWGTEVGDAAIEALFDRLAGPEGLTERAASFTRADVICALGTALGGASDAAGLVGLADRFLASPRVCPLPEHRPGRPRARILDGSGEYVTDLPNAAFTTPELAEIERRLIHITTAGLGTPGPDASAAAVAAALAARPELSSEQAAMVRSVCRSTDALRLVVGYPGAGKTFAAEATVAAFRASGVPVVGCAVTAEAADELACSTGLGVGPGSCDTLARLLLDLDHPQYGGLSPGSVVIVDEASTVSHRELDALVTHVARAGGALVLIGDPKQHGPVGPGHFFGWAVEHAGDRVAALRANHRQRDVLNEEGHVVTSLAAERLASLEYRDGRIAESLARRDADGKVVRAGSAGELYDAMAADWYVEWRHGARDPMIAARNSVREQLNRRARLLREAAGELTGPAIGVGGREFRVGDWVVTRHNHRRLRSADGSWYVKNGSRGIVVDAVPQGSLVVDFDGRAGLGHRVLLPADYVASGYVEWGYAVTDYGIQSRTLDRARAVLDDGTSAAGAYVATTRGRLENRIYIVDGTVAEEPDPDLSHGPPDERPSSLEVIAERLAAQQPEPLLHEIDPWVADAGPLASARSLRRLHHALARADEILAAAPPDVGRRIAGAERRQQDLMARRRVVTDRLAALAEDSPTRHGGSRRRTAHEDGRLRRELGAVDSELAVVAGRLGWLRRRDAERSAYLDAHADARKERDTLRDAVDGREVKIRLAAPVLLPPAFVDQLSEPDASARWGERQGRRRALERAALYRDRWGVTAEAPDDAEGTAAPGTWVLGRRADDLAARREWDAAARAIDAATRAGRDPGPTPDLGPDL